MDNNNNKIQSIITNLENKNKDLIDKGYVLTGIITFDVNKKEEGSIGGGKKSANVNYTDAHTSQGSVQVRDTNSRRDFIDQSERIESLGIHGNFVRLAANDPDIADILWGLQEIGNLNTLALSLQNSLSSSVDGTPLLYVRAYHSNVSTGFESGIGFWELTQNPDAPNNFHTQFVHLSIHVPQGMPTININPTVVRVRPPGFSGRPRLARNIQDGTWERGNTRMRNLGAVHIRGSSRSTSGQQTVSDYESSRRAISFEFAWTIDDEGRYYLQIYNYITTAGANDNLIIRNIDAIIRILNESLRQRSLALTRVGPKTTRSVNEPSTFYPGSPPPPPPPPPSGPSKRGSSRRGSSSRGSSSRASVIATGGKIKKKETKKNKKMKKSKKMKKMKKTRKMKKSKKSKK